MKYFSEKTKRTYDLAKPTKISIEQSFDDHQPNHFGTPPATRQSLQLGDFTGSTRSGGSCNVDRIELVTHCTGTHTESVGHIVDNDVPISQIEMPCFLEPEIVTIEPESASQSRESYRPPFVAADFVITATALQQSIVSDGELDSLIIRTRPNDPSKKSRTYDDQQQAAFFTIEAIQWINQRNIRHLLVDLPSLDRMFDDGLLTAHHIFWKVPEGTHQKTSDTDTGKTVTEMIFVDDSIPDGYYLLNLQLADWKTDAAVSRPIIFPETTTT